MALHITGSDAHPDYIRQHPVNSRLSCLAHCTVPWGTPTPRPHTHVVLCVAGQMPGSFIACWQDGEVVKAVPLPPETCRIGSCTASNGIVDAHPLVSGQHALLIRKNDEVLIQDLESRRGTFMDGVHLTPKRVYNWPHGSCLSFGNSKTSAEWMKGIKYYVLCHPCHGSLPTTTAEEKAAARVSVAYTREESMHADRNQHIAKRQAEEAAMSETKLREAKLREVKLRTKSAVDLSRCGTRARTRLYSSSVGELLGVGSTYMQYAYSRLHTYACAHLYAGVRSQQWSRWN